MALLAFIASNGKMGYTVIMAVMVIKAIKLLFLHRL
jgi:hypothetical protein